ncbi:hypothetical protein F511_30343 [Dorcoceras hygrometricum]|uniref:Uncharacterized protein n=1 Tax=Dorcoceras hygrometricum TaxID=472368 RepID=A0A2Z7D6M6_9LAMI|nr:hypothetical protein F511_30343 [Dorcoceras hygrometricum]
MPSRRRGSAGRQVVCEPRALDSNEVEDIAQPNVPLRHRARQTEVEMESLTQHIYDMDLVLARFQWMNHLTFSGVEGGLAAEECIAHMETTSPLLSPNDQVFSHRKRLGSEDLLNLSTRALASSSECDVEGAS